MIKYSIYIHTFPNNKKYVGATRQNPSRRWHGGSSYHDQDLMKKAIAKYGWENIKHEVVFTNLTREEAEQKEIELIAEYKSNQREFGYNIESGGNLRSKVSDETKRKIGLAHKGKIVSEATRQKQREKALGRKLSEETKKKLSAIHKGRKISEITRQRRSLARKGKPQHPNTLTKLRQMGAERRKPILQYTLNGEFVKEWESASKAGTELKINIGNLCRCGQGLKANAGKFIWKYKE